MSQVKLFFIFLVTISGVSFAATFLQLSRAKTFPVKIIINNKLNKTCHKLAKTYSFDNKQKIGKDFYNKAIIFSLNGNANKARLNSQCAALYTQKFNTWDFDPNILINK